MSDSEPKRGKPIRKLAPEPPFLWVCKTALWRIRDTNATSPQVKSKAMSNLVYMALCECASDAENNVFRVGAGLIAGKAGVTKRTVTRTLPDLVKIGLIEVTHSKRPGTKENDENLYKLISFSKDTQSTPRDTQSTGSDSQSVTVCPSSRKDGVVRYNNTVSDSENIPNNPAATADAAAGVGNKKYRLNRMQRELANKAFERFAPFADALDVRDGLYKAIGDAAMELACDPEPSYSTKLPSDWPKLIKAGHEFMRQTVRGKEVKVQSQVVDLMWDDSDLMGFVGWNIHSETFEKIHPNALKHHLAEKVSTPLKESI